MNTRFDLVLGAGGIGSGVLWQLDDNRILDRDESRGAKLSEARDYCKQHIILHYLSQVMGEEANIYAIGKTGDDDAGRRLRSEMRDAGIKMDFVEEVAGGITMQSVCIQYPDFHVCNLTSSNSVNGEVDAGYILQCLRRITDPVGSRTVVVAVPEVPLQARIALLEYGKKLGAFCAASVLYDEAVDFVNQNGLSLCDLLVVNETEAKALLGKDLKGENLAHEFTLVPDLRGCMVAITCGELGAFTIEAGIVVHTPALPVKVASTAGAGDAFTAGLICGLHLGLPFHTVSSQHCRTGFGSAVELAAAFAAKSVECVHTICPDINRSFVKGVINAL